jgi:hypothetical protein
VLDFCLSDLQSYKARLPALSHLAMFIPVAAFFGRRKIWLHHNADSPCIAVSKLDPFRCFSGDGGVKLRRILFFSALRVSGASRSFPGQGKKDTTSCS